MLGSPESQKPQYFVGIGASAGGLEPLQKFFSRVPSDSGLAYFVIQHLSPDYESFMPELLQKTAKIPVANAENGVEIEANRVYLLPPRSEMILVAGRIVLSELPDARSPFLPVDQFLSSLAKEMGDRSIAVILSGAGGDGARGVLDIHRAGGLVFVQDPLSSEFNGMPARAIGTGAVDAVAEPEAIPDLILEALTGCQSSDVSTMRLDRVRLRPVFERLHREFDLNFQDYRPGTIVRRIVRRLTLHSLSSLDEYLSFIEANPEELKALYKDLLIGVTEFFRDPEAFEILKSQVIPELLRSQGSGDEIRVWVPGCATGEEAYSLAILFDAEAERMGVHPVVKIFATDVHRESLITASTGIYDRERLKKLRPEYLRKYFVPKNDSYLVAPEIRKSIIFSPHNLIKDPPFTRVDLISCRNLLIYLDPEVQKRVCGFFQFSLRPEGFLFLGPSESLGEFSDAFEPIDRGWRIFKRLESFARPQIRFPMAATESIRVQGSYQPVLLTPVNKDVNIFAAYEDLFDELIPCGILMTSRFKLLHVFGDAGRLIRHQGRFSENLLSMVNSELRLALSDAVNQALSTKQTVVVEGVRATEGKDPLRVRLTVQSLRRSRENTSLLLLNFLIEDLPKDSNQPTVIQFDPENSTGHRIKELENELQRTRDLLQTADEAHRTSSEELQSTVEELMSANEELQSTNEELHSLNEELHTINAEYQQKITELNELQQDMDSLLRGNKVETLFLDKELRVRRYTANIGNTVFNLLPRDVGRSLHDISTNVENPALNDEIGKILKTGKPLDMEVKHHSGAWLLLRGLPYKPKSGNWQGVLLTLTDISYLKELKEAFMIAFESAPAAGMVVVNAEGRIVLANRRAESLFGYKRDELIGRDLELLLPAPLREEHVALRSEYSKKPELRQMGPGRVLEGLRKDGSKFRINVGLNPYAQNGNQYVLASIVGVESEPDGLVSNGHMSGSSSEIRNPGRV